MPSDWLKSSPGVENRLREAGIPGIKYVDQGSRGKLSMEDLQNNLKIAQDRMKETGGAPFAKTALFRAKQAIKDYESPTSNFVVFNDALIDIVRKYGIAAIAAIPPAFSQKQQ